MSDCEDVGTSPAARAARAPGDPRPSSRSMDSSKVPAGHDLHAGSPSLTQRILRWPVYVLGMTPLNEISRGATLLAVGAATHNSVLATAVFAGLTLLIEVPTVLVMSDVLEEDKDKGRIEKINRVLKKAKLGGILKTNALSETGIGYLLGSGYLLVIKHRQNPARSWEDNRRYGIALALVLTGLSVPTGYAIAEGVSHPSAVTIAGAFLVLGSVYGTAKWAVHRITKGKLDHVA